MPYRVVFRRRFVTVLAALALLVGAATVASASRSGGLVYSLVDIVSNSRFVTNSIYGFRLDAVTGALTPLPGFPVGSGGAGAGLTAAEAMRYDPVNDRLFVLNMGSATVSVFAVNRWSGALTALPFSPIPLPPVVGAAWGSLAVHPSGSPLLVGDYNAQHIASFVVTATSATAASGSPWSISTAPFSLAFGGSGNYAYAGGNLGSMMDGFNVERSTGVLTPLPGSPFDSGMQYPLGYATDGSGRLFNASFGQGQLRVFTTVSGIPTGAAGNPFVSGLAAAVHAVLHPGGFYMAADRGGNSVGMYRIAGSGAATTLSPVSGSPFASGGVFTDALALTHDGTLLVAANGDSRNLTVFRVDAAAGSLTSLVVQPANALGGVGRIIGMAYAPTPTAFDVDGDVRADVSVYRPSDSTWYVLRSGDDNLTYGAYTWGVATDTRVAADYDGDGKTDLAIYRSGAWWILQSRSNFTTAVAYVWGVSTDVPVPADYDGDGKADLAIFRPSTGVWWVLKSSTNFAGFESSAWGVSTDIPVPADYTGDGRADFAIYRPSTGAWWIKTGERTSVSYTWGVSTDVPVPADYDGDGKADLAIYRGGEWWIAQSRSNFATSVAYFWGAGSDTAVPADYDGDGQTDVAIYRPSTGVWWVLRSDSGHTSAFSRTWGLSGDIPIARRP